MMFNQIWLYSLSSVLLISLISLIGIFTFFIKVKKLKEILSFLASFAAGALLGDVFIHLLPEMAFQRKLNSLFFLIILGGIILFFILEKIICWHHCRLPSPKNGSRHLGLMNLIGDSLHNFTDGAIIAAAFMTDISLGIATSLAVAFHEIPQEMADFSVLIYARFSRIKALFFNFLSALTAFLGALATLIAGRQLNQLTEILIPFTAGSFIYIALADLIPELKKEQSLKKSFFQLTSLLAGVLIMKFIQ